jgi:hypothetical protein
LAVKVKKRAVDNVLKTLTKFHKIENPTRVISNVTIADQVIAVRNENKLVVVSKFKEDRFFSTVFEKCHGIRGGLTIRVNFSNYTFLPEKEECSCLIS